MSYNRQKIYICCAPAMTGYQSLFTKYIDPIWALGDTADPWYDLPLGGH